MWRGYFLGHGNRPGVDAAGRRHYVRPLPGPGDVIPAQSPGYFGDKIDFGVVSPLPSINYVVGPVQLEGLVGGNFTLSLGLGQPAVEFLVRHREPALQGADIIKTESSGQDGADAALQFGFEVAAQSLTKPDGYILVEFPLFGVELALFGVELALFGVELALFGDKAVYIVQAGFDQLVELALLGVELLNWRCSVLKFS